MFADCGLRSRAPATGSAPLVIGLRGHAGTGMDAIDMRQCGARFRGTGGAAGMAVAACL